MPKFVIHKKGFFYTDEAFESPEDTHGSIVGTYATLESATAAKKEVDIVSLQKMKGWNAVDFFFYNKNYDEVYGKMEAYYKSEFGLTIDDKYYFEFPKEITKEQASMFLSILDQSFHDIVEYPDDIVLDPNSFNLQEQELDEF